MIALYFAVDKNPGYDGALWAVAPAQVNRFFKLGTGLLSALSDNVQPFFDEVFERTWSPTDDAVAFVPAEVDARMLVQYSMFTIHRSSTPLETLLAKGPDGIVRKWAIPKAAKPEIKRELELAGIRRANIFPDLANLAADLESTV